MLAGAGTPKRRHRTIAALSRGGAALLALLALSESSAARASAHVTHRAPAGLRASIGSGFGVTGSLLGAESSFRRAIVLEGKMREPPVNAKAAAPAAAAGKAAPAKARPEAFGAR